MTSLTNMAELKLNRALSIKWQYDATTPRSHIMLLREYLRRMALWTVVLKSKYIGVFWAFYDVGKKISPSIRASDEMMNTLDKGLQTHDLQSLPLNICQWYVHWGALEDSNMTLPYDLPTPYEPAIMMFERGVRILRIEHGNAIYVNAQGLMLGGGPEHYESIDAISIPLDHKHLDEIDRSAS